MSLMSLARFRARAPLLALVTTTACASGGRPGSAVAAAGAAPTAGFQQAAITFTSRGDTLHGTLFVPTSPGRHPAIVMVHGSGAEDRSVNREMALAFAGSGIAALTYDKRGSGASGGDVKAATFGLLTADAANAAIAIRSRPDIDGNRIGVYGHGQGATMIPMVAERDATIAFLVAVGPTGVASDSLDELRFDPDAHWRSISGSVFLAWGAKDTRVAVAKSRDILSRSMKRDAPRTDMACVYADADEEIRVGGKAAPAFVQDVTQWVRVATALDALPPAGYSAACTPIGG